LALDRGDEAVHQRLTDLVRGRALALAGELEGVERRLAVAALHHRVQRLGAFVGRVGRLVEQGIELLAGTENRLQGKHASHAPTVAGGTAIRARL